MEPEPEPVDTVAAVAAGVAAGADQIDESMSDIGDMMADMFGAVAIAIDGQAQGGPRAVVAARRRQRELDEQEQRDKDAAAAAALVAAGALRTAEAGARVGTPPAARSGAAASRARVLAPGSPATPGRPTSAAATGSPPTPPPPKRDDAAAEAEKARRRAESRAEEIRLRGAFEEEAAAVEKLRTPQKGDAADPEGEIWSSDED